MQSSLKDFLEKVEQKTEELKSKSIEIKPRYNPAEEQEAVERLNKEWRKISHKARFEDFLDTVLCVLERKEQEYKEIVQRLERDVLDVFVRMFSILMEYYTFRYNYGDVLGQFHMQNFSSKMRGEFYTPFNVALCMAEMLDPKPEDAVIDPAAGSGVMLLATRYVIHKKHGWLESSKFGRKLYGIDINQTAVKMTKTQLCLTDYVYMGCLLFDAARMVKCGLRNGEGQGKY